VQGLEPGDEVFGWSTSGTLAEYTSAPADNFAPKPVNLSMEQAAAVPVSAFTALQALRDIAKVQPEQTVLITGASGGGSIRPEVGAPHTRFLASEGPRQGAATVPPVVPRSPEMEN
jgi:D-arabinose 1-dehydrogenase-like Zn-dependent alcohol dehydrogenase